MLEPMLVSPLPCFIVTALIAYSILEKTKYTNNNTDKSIEYVCYP